LAPQTRLRNPRDPWKFAFLATAAKDGDVAYVGSDWNEGIEPYAFGMPYDPGEAEPLLRGTVFSDRGVYKLGEEVHFKAILRRDAARRGCHCAGRRSAQGDRDGALPVRRGDGESPGRLELLAHAGYGSAAGRSEPVLFRPLRVRWLLRRGRAARVESTGREDR